MILYLQMYLKLFPQNALLDKIGKHLLVTYNFLKFVYSTF